MQRMDEQTWLTGMAQYISNGRLYDTDERNIPNPLSPIFYAPPFPHTHRLFSGIYKTNHPIYEGKKALLFGGRKPFCTKGRWTPYHYNWHLSVVPILLLLPFFFFLTLSSSSHTLLFSFPSPQPLRGGPFNYKLLSVFFFLSPFIYFMGGGGREKLEVGWRLWVG